MAIAAVAKFFVEHLVCFISCFSDTFLQTSTWRLYPQRRKEVVVVSHVIAPGWVPVSAFASFTSFPPFTYKRKQKHRHTFTANNPLFMHDVRENLSSGQSHSVIVEPTSEPRPARGTIIVVAPHRRL